MSAVLLRRIEEKMCCVLRSITGTQQNTVEKRYTKRRCGAIKSNVMQVQQSNQPKKRGFYEEENGSNDSGGS
jgi:hypothetical protein